MLRLRNSKNRIRNKKRKSNPRELDATFSLIEFEKIHNFLIREGFKIQKEMSDVYIKDNIVILMDYSKLLNNASGRILIYPEEDVKNLKGKSLMDVNISPMNSYPLNKRGLKYLDEDIESFKESHKVFKKILEF